MEMKWLEECGHTPNASKTESLFCIWYIAILFPSIEKNVLNQMSMCLIQVSWFSVISETDKDIRHFAKALKELNVQHLGS